MITIAKIKTYTKYEGDIDSWVRSGSRKERGIINERDWYLIDSLLQDLKLIKNGLAGDVFSSNVESKLLENCDSLETAEQIRRLAFK